MTWHRFLLTTEDVTNEKESGVEPPHSKERDRRSRLDEDVA
jgi:hypothetical protein